MFRCRSIPTGSSRSTLAQFWAKKHPPYTLGFVGLLTVPLLTRLIDTQGIYAESKNWFIVILEGTHPQQRWGLSGKILQRMSCASVRDGMRQLETDRQTTS